MDALQLAAKLAGGVGLFLLGMAMMTDGLRLAAGPALERILAQATRTRWHAFGSGVLVTALVQSSSAVTVAAIGFVNAGLLGLGGALWVLFGANVGTTMTGWIVALVGLKFKIEALALPLVGLGAALRLTGQGSRRAPLGDALAGFGLLFLGIAMLQDAFGGLAARIELPQGEGLLPVLAQLLAGLLMTVLMQSSSASMTVALTAAQGGLLSAQGAAAVVIGANIGTTVTAVLASLGATANAKRAAAAHVLFNVLTAVVALALLPWLVAALAELRAALGLPADPAAKLALFHTLFNLLGVLLMWPVADRLTAKLQQHFRSGEDEAARTRYLDDNVLAVPALALEALQRELGRAGQHVRAVLRALPAGAAGSQADHRAAAALLRACERFVDRVQRAALTPALAQRLAQLLRQLRYQQTALEMAAIAAGALDRSPAAGDDRRTLPGSVAAVDDAGAAALRQAAAHWLEALESAARAEGAAAHADDAAAAPRDVAARHAAFEAAYQQRKAELLHAAATTAGRIEAIDAALDALSAWRRALQQAEKAVLRAPTAPGP
jgi:phosphate:Na+ symporter